jgi:dephospho-CoA kinase
MRKLGLTGGIASGKTWVADKLRELGFRVLDADSLGHKLMQPGQSAYSEIVGFFGPAILSAENLIDRKKLGAVVFADSAKLAKLNAILHPKIEAAMNEQFEAWRAEGITDPVFVEAALLVEAGMHKRLDGLVVVWCTPTQQLNRLVARGLKEPEARRRISLQMPPEEKLKYATYQIDTTGTFEQSQQQIEALAKALRSAIT